MILPGVGAFGSFMEGLRQRGLVRAAAEVHAGAATRCLGICVGMQALFEIGEEMGEHPGLGAAVRAGWCAFHDFPDLKVPHTGWNQLWSPREIAALCGH